MIPSPYLFNGQAELWAVTLLVTAFGLFCHIFLWQQPKGSFSFEL